MEFFNLTKMKLAKRLGISFGALTIWAAAIGGVGWWALSAINAAMDDAITQSHRTEVAQAIVKNIDDISLNVWNILARDDAAGNKSTRPTSNGSGAPTARGCQT